MRITPETIPIINTATYQRLEGVIENIAKTAGLGIVKGPVGIGKSFALRQLKKTYRARGYGFVMTTARPETEGAITYFVNDILEQYHGRETRKGDAVYALRTLILREDYTFNREPIILVVDESQGLKPNILETLRGLYDEGDLFRRGDKSAPAFGLMFVGNPRFLARSGRAQSAQYDQLMDRVSVQIELRRPSAVECLELANAFAPNDPEAAKILAELGMARGNLRGIEKAAMQARFLDGGRGLITSANVKEALFLLKGGK